MYEVVITRIKEKEILPCNASMAVAAWAGLTKSTKQSNSGSPPGCT
jgi:hypothetical protein